ncbi:MAG: hypothetical protein AB7Q17_00590 [Phycisphaerae bacterium]
MAAKPHSEPAPADSAWPARISFWLSVLLAWAALRFLAAPLLVPPGIERPVVLAASWSALLGAPLFLCVVAAAGAITAAMAPERHATRPMIVLGVALALWAATGGTMDDWLKLRNERVEPGRAAPYLALLPDYALLAAGVSGAAFCASWVLARRSRPAAGVDPAGPIAGGANARRAGAGANRAAPANGVLCLLTTALISAVALLVLMGPRVATTRRGQVFFALTAAFFVGALAAHRLFRVADARWYWPAPLLVGGAGILYAALQPALPAPYTQVNIIPVHALVRALPIEMIGVGMVAVLWGLHFGEASEHGE